MERALNSSTRKSLYHVQTMLAAIYGGKNSLPYCFLNSHDKAYLPRWRV